MPIDKIKSCLILSAKQKTTNWHFLQKVLNQETFQQHQESSVHKIRNHEINNGESIIIATTLARFLPPNAPKNVVAKKTVTNFMMNALLESNTFRQLQTVHC